MAIRLPQVSATNAAGFPKPSGTKITTSRCVTPNWPIPCNVDGPSHESFPILLDGHNTYWPLSYDDDRFSFAIVRTSRTSTKPIDIFEIKGARYIDSIEVSAGNETVTFIGQGYNVVSVPWNNLSDSVASSSSPLSLSSVSSTFVPSTSDLEDDLKVGAIVGIVVGSVLGAMIIVIGGYLYWQMLRENRREASSRGQIHSIDESGYGEPDIGDQSPLVSRGRRESFRTTDSRSINSSHVRAGSVPGYGTLPRSNTFNSIGSNFDIDGLGDPGSN